MDVRPAVRKTFSPAGKIWVVLHLRPLKRGSMEQQLLAIGRRLRARGTEVTYVFGQPPAPWLSDALSELSIAWKTLDFSRPFAAAVRLGAWLVEARPALVHFHFVRAYSPLIPAARLCGAKVVVNDHVTLTRAGDSLAREAYKHARATALNPLIDRRIAVSRSVADSVIDIEHVDPERVTVIENGIDLDRFARADGRAARAALAGERPLLLCVSRLQPEKGVETAIRALPLIGRGAVLALAGDGPMASEWQALAGALGVGAQVRFLGVRDDVEQLIAAADVVLVPSHWEEAFGLVVVEAMAAGKPVVVSASGAMPAIVDTTGLVVPKRDPGALAGAVTRLLDDPLLRARLGRAARRRARECFGLPRYVDRVISLYDELAPAPAASRAA
ncbi:MAG TPA: glycosyltransferase family 4 protein [Kofleriaceae bacterium]|nr:glycosyltransferase family 4 protein [Kofleriaceae bacterium]